jgi:N-acetylneuraminic acid mutarotase
MPTARNGLALATSNNGRLYAIGGQTGDGTVLSVVEEYDPATDTWAPVASLPSARAGLGAAVSGGKIYVIGGKNTAGSSLATNERAATPPCKGRSC